MGVETVREFNVITQGYSAEYGKHTGGVFNAITKSGSNSFHGSGFDFLRNNDLDARNFFDIPKIVPLKRNQMGATLGGPIKKDHTFFFGSYEGLRQRKGLTQTFNVPDADARNGIIHNANGTTTTVAVSPAVAPRELLPASQHNHRHGPWRGGVHPTFYFPDQRKLRYREG